MSCRETIEENGFDVIPGLFSSDCMDRLLEAVDRLAPRRSRAGIRHALGLAPVAGIARQTQVIGLARAVIGPDAFPFRATLFDKSPQSNWLVVWHQDTALPLRERIDVPGWGPWSVKEGIRYAHGPAAALSQVLAVRIHLDDSNIENGPLRVLPRTHRLGVLSDDTLHELSMEIGAVDCVVPKGGVVVIRPLVVHASSKSQVGAPRRVLHIEYAASDSIAMPLELATA
jgi:ectoine hydroxylase-related dioxygenase (phytanoyl-CoA dioxygenase family)